MFKKWIKKTNQQEKDSEKHTSTSHMNGHEEQPVRRSIDLTSMFNSEKVIFFSILSIFHQILVI